jgi:hypothetical protein
LIRSCPQGSSQIAQHASGNGEFCERQLAAVGQRQDLTADMRDPVLVGLEPFLGRIGSLRVAVERGAGDDPPGLGDLVQAARQRQSLEVIRDRNPVDGSDDSSQPEGFGNGKEGLRRPTQVGASNRRPRGRCQAPASNHQGLQYVSPDRREPPVR